MFNKQLSNPYYMKNLKLWDYIDIYKHFLALKDSTVRE